MTRPPLRRRAWLLALALGPLVPQTGQARGAGGRGSLKLYRRDGRYAGRVDGDGRHYDAMGRYVGAVRGQRVYDAQGRYLGRFEESGVFWGPGDPGMPAELPAVQALPVEGRPDPNRGMDLIEIVRDPAASAPRRR